VGLPVIVCPEAAEHVVNGDELRIDMEKGEIEVAGKGAKLAFKPLPEFLIRILNEGGLVAYTRKRIG